MSTDAAQKQRQSASEPVRARHDDGYSTNGPLTRDDTPPTRLSRSRSRSSTSTASTHYPDNANAEKQKKLATDGPETSGPITSHVRQGASEDKQRKHAGLEKFEVTWDGDDDPKNPRNLHVARKWLIVILVSLGSFSVTNASSVYTLTYDQITQEFHCSRLVATIGLSVYIFGLGLGPMFLGPLSEFYGRRPILAGSYSMFLIWLIPCAVARNLATMLVGRFLDGLAGSAFLSVAGGTVGDMFARTELQGPMMIYTASPFLGPGLGPVYAGFINYHISWRWSFYVLLIFAGILNTAICILVPETYHPVLLRNKARRLRKETGDERYQAPIERMDRSVVQTVIRSCYRPFLLLTREYMVSNLCLFSSILLGILYLFFGAFNLVFSAVYKFNLWQVGMSFLGLSVGMVVAILSDPLWHKNYERLVRNYQKATGISDGSEPEFRLPPAIGGAPLTVIGLFWFAWTLYSSVHWIVPIVGSAFFGCGTILVFSGVFTFLVDAYPVYAASALSANSFARSTFAAVFPLFGVQMYNRLGFQWATTLLAFLTAALAPFPYVFFRYGKKIRQRSKFASAKA